MITGGAGFIGSHVVRLFVRKYPEYRIINVDKLTYAGNLENLKDVENSSNYVFERADICDFERICGLMRSYDVDGVIHLAAESHVDRSIRDPFTFARTNVMGTLSLLEAARRYWEGLPGGYEGRRFYHISTDEVYGALGEEGYFTEETPLCPHSPYSASKASADFIVCAYRDTYHFPVSITRCSNNYGPYHFPEKLIPLIINNILEGKKLPVYGQGLNVRDWLYVEDHCKAIDLVINNGRDGCIYNVGGHNEQRNIDIVKLIIDIVHRTMESRPEFRVLLKRQELDAEGKTDISWINYDLITFVKDRLGHDLRYAIDPTKIKNDLGWYPETTFAEGIEKTVLWNLENRKWVNEVTSGEYQQYYDHMYSRR